MNKMDSQILLIGCIFVAMLIQLWNARQSKLDQSKLDKIYTDADNKYILKACRLGSDAQETKDALAEVLRLTRLRADREADKATPEEALFNIVRKERKTLDELKKREFDDTFDTLTRTKAWKDPDESTYPTVRLPWEKP